MCQVSLTEPGMYIAVSRNAGYRRAPKSTLDSPMTSASSSPSPLEKKNTPPPSPPLSLLIHLHGPSWVKRDISLFLRNLLSPANPS